MSGLDDSYSHRHRWRDPAPMFGGLRERISGLRAFARGFAIGVALGSLFSLMMIGIGTVVGARRALQRPPK